jgi:uncharacterized protein YqhQ
MNLFVNALIFEPQNVSVFALLFAGITWLALLVIISIDIFTTSHLKTIWKIVWLHIVIGLPVLGGLFYGAANLIRCFKEKTLAV